MNLEYRDNLEDLCSAIISLAAKDLAEALTTLKLSPGNTKAAEARDEIEEFFQSAWFNVLTEMDGGYIVKLIIEEVERDGAVSNRD